MSFGKLIKLAKRKSQIMFELDCICCIHNYSENIWICLLIKHLIYIGIIKWSSKNRYCSFKDCHVKMLHLSCCQHFPVVDKTSNLWPRNTSLCGLLTFYNDGMDKISVKTWPRFLLLKQWSHYWHGTDNIDIVKSLYNHKSLFRFKPCLVRFFMIRHMKWYTFN